jgi:hypothetical protein
VLSAHEHEADSPLSVCDASSAWLAAELRVPFAKPTIAISTHCHRILDLINNEEKWLNNDTVEWATNGREEHIKRLNRIKDYHKQAIEQLRAAEGS